MADDHRKFEDAQGRGWEVRAEKDYKWYFVPLEGNDSLRKIVAPPPTVSDPFEVDEKELHKLLASGIPTRGITEPLPTTGEDEEG